MNRAALFLILLSVSLAVSTANPKDASFTGTWDTLEDKDSSYSFSLFLTQTQDRLEGGHIVVAFRGKRIDAALPEDGPPSIKGTIVNGVAHIKFTSGYSDATGEASVTLKGNKIEWKIINSSIGHYLPKTATLYRRKK